MNERCECGGLLEFQYHTVYRCRECGRSASEEHPAPPPIRLPFLSTTAVKPRPHARGRGNDHE